MSGPTNATPAAQTRKNWFLRHKIMSTLGGIVIVFVIIGASSSNGTTTNNGGTSNTPTASSTDAATNTADNTGTQPAKPKATKSKAAPDMTVAQENAMRSAKNYLSMSGFSRKGLIGQLKYDGFSKSNAAFAVDALNVDWNEQAVRSAKNYLKLSGFSHSGLVQQLTYDGYTRSQAEYGVRHNGL